MINRLKNKEKDEYSWLKEDLNTIWKLVEFTKYLFNNQSNSFDSLIIQHLVSDVAYLFAFQIIIRLKFNFPINIGNLKIDDIETQFNFIQDEIEMIHSFLKTDYIREDLSILNEMMCNIAESILQLLKPEFDYNLPILEKKFHFIFKYIECTQILELSFQDLYGYNNSNNLASDYMFVN